MASCINTYPRTKGGDDSNWFKRQVYAKLTDKEYMLSIINGTGGQGE
jgi:hypothetical protein